MNLKFNVSKLVKIGIMSAIATVVMLFEIPLWFAPPFYKIDLSEAVVLIGGFALGPLSAVFIELVKILLNFLINGTITAGIGEVANFVIGLSFVLPAVIIYRHKKSFNSALLGLIVGTLCLAAVGGLANMYVLLPVYASVFGMPIDALTAMGSKLNSHITSLPTFILFATTPFNLLKGVVSSLIALLLYKKLSPILHK